MRELEIFVQSKTFLKNLVYKHAHLWEPVNALSDLHVNLTILNFDVEVVLFYEFVWDYIGADMNVFKTLYWGLEIKITASAHM